MLPLLVAGWVCGVWLSATVRRWLRASLPCYLYWWLGGCAAASCFLRACCEILTASPATRVSFIVYCGVVTSGCLCSPSSALPMAMRDYDKSMQEDAPVTDEARATRPRTGAGPDSDNGSDVALPNEGFHQEHVNSAFDYREPETRGKGSTHKTGSYPDSRGDDGGKGSTYKTGSYPDSRGYAPYNGAGGEPSQQWTEDANFRNNAWPDGAAGKTNVSSLTDNAAAVAHQSWQSYAPTQEFVPFQPPPSPLSSTDELKDSFDEMKTFMESIHSLVIQIPSKFDALEQKVLPRLIDLEAKYVAHETMLTAHQAILDAHSEKHEATNVITMEHEKRIAELEKMIKALANTAPTVRDISLIWDRKPDTLVLIANADGGAELDLAATRTAIHELAKSANLDTDTLLVNGKQGDRRLFIRFKGPRSTAERRIRALRQATRTVEGPYKDDIVTKTTDGRIVRFYLNPDRNLQTIKLQKACNTLATVMRSPPLNFKLFADMESGHIIIDGGQVAFVEVSEKQPPKLSFSAAALVKYKLSKSDIEAAFHAVGTKTTTADVVAVNDWC